MKKITSTGEHIGRDVLKLFGYEPIEPPALKPLESWWQEGTPSQPDQSLERSERLAAYEETLVPFNFR